jgi:hypothetical protein
MSNLYTVTAEFDTYIQACLAASLMVGQGLIAEVDDETATLKIIGISSPILFKIHDNLKLIGPRVTITEEVSE